MKQKDLITELCERPFSPKVTLGQIIEEGKNDFFQWNIKQEILTITNEHNEVVGMFLKFQHPNYNDLLFITLGWEDLYHIRFMNEEKHITHEVEGLYHDQLFEVVDRYIKDLKPKLFSEICLN